MNDMNQVIDMVSGLLAVEGKVNGVELLKTLEEEGIKQTLTARAVLTMKKQGAIKLEGGDGLSLSNNDVIFVKEYDTSLETPTPKGDAPKDKRYPFGFDIQVDYRTGRSYKRRRTEFDGEKFSLPEEYELKKKDFQKFSLALIQAIPEFNGAGEHAIAILNEDPALAKFEDRNGNIYYRWNGQRIIECMDKYWPYVQILIRDEENNKIEVDAED